MELIAGRRHYTCDTVDVDSQAVNNKVVDRGLENGQPRLTLEPLPDRALVELAVSLRALLLPYYSAPLSTIGVLAQLINRYGRW